MSCTVAAKKGKHEGEAGGQTPVGKQRGTEKKMLDVLWNEMRLPSGKFQHAFQPNPLYLSSLRAELSAP